MQIPISQLYMQTWKLPVSRALDEHMTWGCIEFKSWIKQKALRIWL